MIRRRNGSLTPGEASRLERGMDRVERYEDRARADGRVSGYERQRLDNMLDREQGAIRRESNDGQRTDGRGWGGRDGWGRDRDGGRHDQYGDNRGWDRDRGGDRRPIGLVPDRVGGFDFGNKIGWHIRLVLAEVWEVCRV